VSDSDGLVAAPTVAADSDGGAVLAYYQLPATATTDGDVTTLVSRGPWRLMVAHRAGDGQGFGRPVAVADLELPDQPELTSGVLPSGHPQPHLVSRLGIAAPALAADGGTMCVGWSDGAEGKLEAFVRCSKDGGASWAGPAGLGAGLDGDSAQWLPQVALGPSGRIDAVFYSGWDNAGGRAADVFYASSIGPGQAFANPLRLTSQSSHLGSAPAPGWFGTGLALTSGPDEALALWTDSRNGLRIYPSQTIFAATIDTPAGGPARRSGGAGVLVAAGLALAGTGLHRRRVGDRYERADEAEV
jgi:hypothetical protein